MDISIRHRKNGGRTWDCLSYLDSTNSPAGKTPLQYSEDHQEKWVQSLAHILHCGMQRDLWILVLDNNITFSCKMVASQLALAYYQMKRFSEAFSQNIGKKSSNFKLVTENPLFIYGMLECISPGLIPSPPPQGYIFSRTGDSHLLGTSTSKPSCLHTTRAS